MHGLFSQGTWAPTHWPAWQASSVVQTVPSLQPAPSAVGTCTQPSTGSHESASMHAAAGGHCTWEPCTQVPLLQTSFSEHGPRSQGVPVSGCWVQLPPTASQTAAWHGLIGGQLVGPVQSPSWQVSLPCVHVLPSSQAVPFGLFG
jgi:hypothetical protein